MSSSSLTAFATQFNRYVPIPIFIFGLIGNILNIVIFTRPSLNKNPCSIYFMFASIANLNVLLFGMVTRFLSDGFGIDPVSNNLGFCRFRYFILHSSMVLSSWLTVLAGFDRYCISSRNIHRRQLSNLKYARYIVALTICICWALYSHVFGLFTIEQLKSGLYCYAQAGTYRIFYDFFYFATYSFIPPIVMICFGLGTFYHVRQTRAQVDPTFHHNNNFNHLRKRDRQLIKMVLVQFIFTVVLTLPIAIQKLYATFTQDQIKSAYQVTAENFFAQLMRILVFVNSSASFYVFLISGSGFRREFGHLTVKIVGYLFDKNGRFYGRVQRYFEFSSMVPIGHKNNTLTMSHYH